MSINSLTQCTELTRLLPLLHRNPYCGWLYPVQRGVLFLQVCEHASCLSTYLHFFLSPFNHSKTQVLWSMIPVPLVSLTGKLNMYFLDSDTNLAAVMSAWRPSWLWSWLPLFYQVSLPPYLPRGAIANHHVHLIRSTGPPSLK